MSQNKPVCVFKKKGQNFRKRKHSSSEEDEETTIVKGVKTNTFSNPLVQSTKIFSKSSGNEIKLTAEISKELSYKSSRTAEREGPSDMGATATIEIDQHTEHAHENPDDGGDDDASGKDIYKGLKNYKKYNEPKETQSQLVKKGPIRAPSNLRSTVRWDYQPDICKDYKETGFCGFGDSCKFMHDRSDYKHGWQIELEMANNTYGEDGTNYEIHSDEDDLPFKCYICRDTFKSPVVTNCKHYFCELCFLNKMKKSHRCYVCGSNTEGFCKPAKDLIRKLASREQKGEKEDDSSCEES